MKKVILFSMLSFSLAAQKQIKNAGSFISTANKTAATTSTLYSFSTYTATYQEITGTLLSGGLKWDEPNYKVPLGFNFELYNQQNDTIIFSGGSFATFNNPLTDPLLTIAAPMFEDLCDKAFLPLTDTEGATGGISPITYTVTGTAGSRICIMQIKNAGFFGENHDNNSSVSIVNFQLWLYETSNDIEFRFGNVDIQNPASNLIHPTGFLCGLAENVDLNTAGSSASDVLGGPHNNPIKTTLSTSGPVVTGQIQSGRVYKFSRYNTNPNTTGIKNNSGLPEPGFYPNPANNVLYFNSALLQQEGATIEFYDLAGKLVLLNKLQKQTDLSQFKKGIYFVKIRSATAGEIYNSKLVIAE